MESVKYSLYSLIAMFISVCFVSCGEDYSSPLKGQTVEDLVFEKGGGSKTISIGTKDLSKCAISSNANWCSARIDISSVEITVQPNDNYDERQSIVTLTDPEDATTLSFKVLQNQKDAILVENETVTIPEEGGDVNIKVQSNVSYTVQIPSDASWLTQSTSSTRGLTSSAIILKAEKNNSGDMRNTEISLINKESKTSTKVKILQTITPYIKIDKDIVEADVNGEVIEIKVNTNVKVDIEYDGTWVRSGGRENSEDFSFVQKIIVDPFKGSLKTRETKIFFANPKWDLYKTITIVQTKSGINIEDSDIEIYEGEERSLSFSNYTDQSVSWKSSNTSVVTVDSKGKIKGVGAGSAIIKVVTADGKYSDEITVTVKKYDIEQYVTTKWQVSTASWNGYKTKAITCKIINNSQVDIELTKCTYYVNDKYYDSTTSSSLLGTLKAGKEKDISLYNISSVNSVYFVLEYSYAGHRYTITTECPAALIALY